MHVTDIIFPFVCSVIHVHINHISALVGMELQTLHAPPKSQCTRQWELVCWACHKPYHVSFHLFDMCLVPVFQNHLIPDDNREGIVSHIVMVHQSVGTFSKDFQQKLRRNNYVTPKHYLDFINTYLRLLEEKDKFILAQVYHTPVLY